MSESKPYHQFKLSLQEAFKGKVEEELRSVVFTKDVVTITTEEGPETFDATDYESYLSHTLRTFEAMYPISKEIKEEVHQALKELKDRKGMVSSYTLSFIKNPKERLQFSYTIV